jgi:hypothetical protein
MCRENYRRPGGFPARVDSQNFAAVASEVARSAPRHSISAGKDPEISVLEADARLLLHAVAWQRELQNQSPIRCFVLDHARTSPSMWLFYRSPPRK